MKLTGVRIGDDSTCRDAGRELAGARDTAEARDKAETRAGA